jgi:multiple sugar transport system permease protein
MKVRILSFVRHVVLVLIAVVSVFPLVWLLRTSLATRREVLSTDLLVTPSLGSYVAVLSGDYPRYLLNSLVIVLVTVVIVMGLGTLAGYGLARFRIKGKESWFFYLLTTRMGPPVAFALPYFLVYQNWGLIDTHIAIIIMYTIINLAFSIWMMRSFFEDVPRSAEEAAMIDGLSRLRAFVRITLPEVTSGLIATATFVFIVSWNEFFYAAMLTRSNARTFTTHLPTFISFSQIRWEELAAASIVGILPVLVFAVFVRRHLVRGLTFGQVR